MIPHLLSALVRSLANFLPSAFSTQLILPSKQALLTHAIDVDSATGSEFEIIHMSESEACEILSKSVSRRKEHIDHSSSSGIFFVWKFSISLTFEIHRQNEIFVSNRRDWIVLATSLFGLLLFTIVIAVVSELGCCRRHIVSISFFLHLAPFFASILPFSTVYPVDSTVLNELSHPFHILCQTN